MSHGTGGTAACKGPSETLLMFGAAQACIFSWAACSGIAVTQHPVAQPPAQGPHPPAPQAPPPLPGPPSTCRPDDAIIASTADTMRAVLEHIDKRYGGARGYLSSLGLSNEEVEAIRANLMQPAAWSHQQRPQAEEQPPHRSEL